MADIEGLEDLAQVADGLEDFTDGNGPDTLQTTIPATVQRLFKSKVLPDVHRRAREHVGEYAETIDDASSWDGENYVHGVGSDSVVVESHEYGSGKYNINGGTLDRPGGYRIPADGDGPLSFNDDGRERVVEYVIHPGVRPKQFMHRGVRDASDDIAEELGDELADALLDQVQR